MLPASRSGDPKSRTPADNQTVRNVVVIGPDKKVKLILVYPMTTGRNFDDVLRVVTKGDVDGVDVGGLNVAMVADAPAVMTDGNWRVGLVHGRRCVRRAGGSARRCLRRTEGRRLRRAGSADRRDARDGDRDLRVHKDDGRSHSVKIGDFVEMDVEDFVSPLDATGKGVHVTGVGFPADTLAAGTAKKSTFNAFGMKWDNTGKNSASAPFAWSA